MRRSVWVHDKKRCLRDIAMSGYTSLKFVLELL